MITVLLMLCIPFGLELKMAVPMQYVVEVSRTEDFSKPLLVVRGLRESELDFFALYRALKDEDSLVLPGEQENFCWRVAAVNEAGMGRFSSGRQFFLTNQAIIWRPKMTQ